MHARLAATLERQSRGLWRRSPVGAGHPAIRRAIENGSALEITLGLFFAATSRTGRGFSSRARVELLPVWLTLA